MLAVSIKHIEEYIKELVSYYETNDDVPLKEFIIDKCISGIHKIEPPVKHKR